MNSTPLRRAVLAVLNVLVILVVGAGVAGCGPNTPSNNDTPDNAWQHALEASASGWILSVAGSSPSNVFAVGGEPDQGRIWRFDGTSWAEQDVPEGVPLLNWVHVFDDGTPVIAGNDGTILRRRDGAWVREQTPTDQDLWGVWGASDDEIWAVGGNGRVGDEATVLVWGPGQAGGGWTKQTVPELERPNVRAFFKVWGSGADDVYIVGQRGAVLHWDGSEFEELLVGTSKDLISVWGTGADNVVVVGGRANAVVAHFDGSDWTTESLAPTPGMNGVWMVEPDTALVAGNAGTFGRLDVASLTLDDERTPTGLDLHAVFGVGDMQLSVGGNFGMPQGPYRGVLMQRRVNP